MTASHGSFGAWDNSCTAIASNGRHSEPVWWHTSTIGDDASVAAVGRLPGQDIGARQVAIADDLGFAFYSLLSRSMCPGLSMPLNADPGTMPTSWQDLLNSTPEDPAHDPSPIPDSCLPPLLITGRNRGVLSIDKATVLFVEHDPVAQAPRTDTHHLPPVKAWAGIQFGGLVDATESLSLHRRPVAICVAPRAVWFAAARTGQCGNDIRAAASAARNTNRNAARSSGNA